MEFQEEVRRDDTCKNVLEVKFEDLALNSQKLTKSIFRRMRLCFLSATIFVIKFGQSGLYRGMRKLKKSFGQIPNDYWGNWKDGTKCIFLTLFRSFGNTVFQEKVTQENKSRKFSLVNISYLH
jgi:hypothetical protein